MLYKDNKILKEDGKTEEWMEKENLQVKKKKNMKTCNRIMKFENEVFVYTGFVIFGWPQICCSVITF